MHERLTFIKPPAGGVEVAAQWDDVGAWCVCFRLELPLKQGKCWLVGNFSEGAASIQQLCAPAARHDGESTEKHGEVAALRSDSRMNLR